MTRRQVVRNQKKRALTPAQKLLLANLVASKGRGSASLSCGGKEPVAEELVALGLAKRVPGVDGKIPFYAVTDKGMER